MRRSQEERRAQTRGAILRGMIDCLDQHGYTGATYARVAERAGVSRGALLYYFPDKVELAVAAADQVRFDAAARAREELTQLPDGPGRIEAALDVLREIFGGPAFQAALEVWVRGRTERALNERLAPVREETIRNVAELLPEAFDPRLAMRDDLLELARLMTAALRGLALDDARIGDQPKAWQFMRETLAGLIRAAAESAPR